MARKPRSSPEADLLIEAFCRHLPHRDSLAGPTYGDNVRHAITRTRLLQLLAQDPAITQMYVRWAKELGIFDAANQVANALELLANARGFRSRGEMLVSDIDGVITFESDDPLMGFEFVRLIAEVERAGDEYALVVDGCDAQIEAVVDDACGFVRSLGYDWVWLVQELLDGFWARLDGFVFGRRLVRTIWAEPANPAAPEIEFAFRTPPDATLSVLLEHLRDTLLIVEKQLEPYLMPAGTIPDRTQSMLERNATWLYRHRFCREPIRTIAAADFGDGIGDPDDRRKDVRRGIAQAEKILGGTSYCLRESA